MSNKKNDLQTFIKSHNLVNRIYDMSIYFGIIKQIQNEENIKNFFNKSLRDVGYVESLAKYFEKKMKKHKKNIDLQCNLRDLVSDLNYLKQYLF